jgi:hypothetical protein
MARKKTFEVKGTLKVDDKGTLKKTGRDAKQAGKGVEKLGKETKKTTYATKKGIIQTANQTKNFANMARGVTGGIVPAYATLAAQIFALGAAFRFLSDAADYRMLKEGQMAFGMATGVAYKTLTDRIIEATDAQITFKDAAQAVAIGTAAGLSPEQLERLAGAAKQVSIALGRDLVDSFNRLIRGTTKAEPELLDELGIILRLEIATKKYAAALGKSKEELSTFEKTQAVTNEVLGQAEDKYGKINAIMDPSTNAFNKFAKSFDDLTNVLRGFLANVLEPLAIYFSKNMVTFGLGLMLFAVPIIKMMIPALSKWGDKMRETVRLNKVALDKEKQNVRNAVKADKKAMDQRQQNFDRAQKRYAQTAKKYGGVGRVTGTGMAGEKRALDHAQKQIDAGLKKRTGRYAKADQDIINSQKRRLQIMTRGEITWGERSKAVVTSWKAHFKVALASVKSAYVSFKGAMIGLATKMGKAMNLAFKLSGILFMVSILVDAARWVYEKFNPVDEAIREANEEARKFIDVQKTLHGELEKMNIVWAKQNELLQTYKEQIEFAGNAINSLDIYGSMTAIQDAMLAGANPAIIKKMTEELGVSLILASKLAPEFKEFGQELIRTNSLTKEHGIQLLNTSNKMVEGLANSKALTEGYKQLNLEINNQVNAYKKLPFEKIIKAYDLIIKNTAKLEGTTIVAEGPDQEKRQKMLDFALAVTKELKTLNEKTAESKKKGLLYDIRSAKLTDPTKATKLAKQRLAYMKQEEAFERKIMLLRGLEYQLSLTTKGVQQDSIKEAIDASKLDLQLENQKLEIAQQRLSIWKQAGEQAKGKLESGVASELKALIMKENTSVRDAMKNIAESLHQTVAQGMADVLTNQLMNVLFGDQAYGTAFNANKDALGLYFDMKSEAKMALKEGGGANKGLIGGLWDTIFSFGRKGTGLQDRMAKIKASGASAEKIAKIGAAIPDGSTAEKALFVRIDPAGIQEILKGMVQYKEGVPLTEKGVKGAEGLDKNLGPLTTELTGENYPAIYKALEENKFFMKDMLDFNNMLGGGIGKGFGWLGKAFSWLGGGASGGVVRKYAGGTGSAGAKFVPGTGSRDSVPSLLTPGEIVIPKGKRIGGNYNTTINVNMEGGGDVTTNDETGEALGMALQQAVTEEIAVQQRPGGLLSPFGG